MGYNLTIGEAEIEYYQENTYEDSTVRITAKGVHDENAPAFGEPTDHTNRRWPSYGAWHNFCEFTNLTDMFYTNRGGRIEFRGGHPGAFPITKDMLFEIKKAKMRLKGRFPTLCPEYDAPDISEEEDMANGALCRLLWLEYWIKWALENCEHPVLANS